MTLKVPLFNETKKVVFFQFKFGILLVNTELSTQTISNNSKIKLRSLIEMILI